MSTPQRRGDDKESEMGPLVTKSNADLRALGNRIERLLMSTVSAFEAEVKMKLYGCYGLSHLLASHCMGHQTGRCDPEVISWMAEGCGYELDPLELAIEESDEWFKRRLMPSEFSANELTLRALLTHIHRYLEGDEPEYSALPVAELDRLMQRVRLLEVWELRDAGYQKALCAALKNLQRARDAAEYEPRN
ncbi:hypothetical protein FE772_00810 [Lysobacter enzymogenes]|nr:hypothetical protein [Lysobacter enzymogenes]QCW24424.1 hypothetical protein FE772_00810 [Lysobacter enzymogenes]